jgi:hypothetical protein
MRNLIVSLFLLMIMFAGCGKPEVKSEMTIVAYPNPASSQVSVYLRNVEMLPFTIRIIDPQGNTFIEHNIGAGVRDNDIKIDLTDKAKGTYQVVVQIGGRVLTDKFYKV